MASTIPWPYPEDGSEDYLRNVALPEMERGDAYHWSIKEKSDPELKHIGSISLYPKRQENNRGFWLGLDYQGRGYMKEAVIAVNDFAFDVLGMSQMILKNAEPNIASNSLKEISGAKIIPDDEEVLYLGGIYRQIRWVLTCEDWQANRHKLIKPVPI